MLIEVAKLAGFCFGVQRAIDIACSTLESPPAEPVWSLGELIHNPQTVAKLAGMGLRVVESIDGIHGGTLVLRSHGVSPEIVARAEACGATVVDATCPFVQRAQEIAARAAEAGNEVVIVGDRNHPEVQAIVGSARGHASVVSCPEEVVRLEIGEKVTLLAQTTQPPANVAACAEVLRQRLPEVVVEKTTCTATERRQAEAAAMAARHPVMVVIGGHQSANTSKLAEICRRAGARTFHIAGPEELRANWFAGAASVGVTAGASTPDWIIEEVVHRMTELTENVEANPQAEAASGQAEMETALKTLERKAHVEGTITKVENDKAYVDIGGKSDAVIPLKELTFRPVEAAAEVVSVGDKVEVEVINPEDEQGETIVSKRRVDEAKAWDSLKAVLESGTTVMAKIVERVKGGLVADVGVRGFLPGSQVSASFVADLTQYVGQTLEVNVLEVDREKRSVILSRKALEEAERKAAQAEAFAKLEVGAVVPGVVKRLATFGAFVDIGGVEGLLHVSELSWNRVQHPSEVVHEGQEINVKILKLDPESGRISLGYRQTLPDPWQQAAPRYPVGKVVSGEVVRVVDFGAFVRLEEGIEGLVHISQLADERVNKTSDVVQPGQTVQVKVLSFDSEQKRVSLSIKQALPPTDHGSRPHSGSGEPRRGGRREPRVSPELMTRDDAPPLTLGDLFGSMFEKNGFNLAPASSERTPAAETPEDEKKTDHKE